VAVRSHDELVHAVTVCVGTNGIHPKTIMRELHGEKVSIVLWSESPERFVLNAVAPFGPSAVQTPKVSVDLDSRRARIEVGPETLAYFKAEDPSRLHLASELVGLDIEIVPLGSG
jgi:N utilization substance protein A